MPHLASTIVHFTWKKKKKKKRSKFTNSKYKQTSVQLTINEVLTLSYYIIKSIIITSCILYMYIVKVKISSHQQFNPAFSMYLSTKLN